VKSRSLGISFIAAVIVPSILLAVLSIRSAGREEAWLEKQVTVTLDAEVAHAAGLADGEVARVIDDLRSGLDIPSGSDYSGILARWKKATPLVAVPYLLSPRYGILWPPSDSRADADQKRFLKENGDFLSDRAATAVLQNIAVKYQGEILAESASGAGSANRATSDRKESAPSASGDQDQANAPRAPAAEASKPVPPAALSKAAPPASSVERQMAIDAFAQNPGLQNKVYEEARQKGDQLSARVVTPKAMASQEAPAANAAAGAAGPAIADNSAEAEKQGLAASPPLATPAVVAESAPPTATVKKDVAAAPQRAAPSPRTTTAPAAPPTAPSQFVVTSQLLSQIASRGEYGVIPRFVTNPPGTSATNPPSTSGGEKLEFLFWERQKDGRIAGCEISSQAFRSRIAGVLESTWTPVRILTLLDENGSPLAFPPNSTGQDWRRPFVAREIGETLPRWEAAAYLTRPDVITSQARSSSLVIWVLVMILFVSVAGGGVMVLSSVYAGMRQAQQKATFVTNVSHELKTPLTSISLFIDLLRRKGPLPPAKKEQYLSLMASETERLTRLINNVLDFSREKGTQRYSMREVDAADIAGQLVESQRVRLERSGFMLSMESSEGPEHTVRGDPEALKQVLLNLLSNAEKYSRDHREITVRVSGSSTEVTIAVADRGIGVPEKEREKIFREFYRVDTSLSSGVQGTGLGLSIARRIARDHGGDITYAARKDGGSQFIVRLPAFSSAAGRKG
jgi:signal transduction histidine kinase